MMRCHLRGTRDRKRTRLQSPEAWRAAGCDASYMPLQMLLHLDPQVALQPEHGFTGVMTVCQNIVQLDLSVVGGFRFELSTAAATMQPS